MTQEKIIECLRAYFEKDEALAFVLLFGSYASGDAHACSDIDVGMYTRGPISLWQQGVVIADLEDALERKIDLVVLNDLYKKDARLAFNIVDNHQLIFCTDQDAYIDFKTNTYKYYFDLQPMYEMFDKALFKRIENGTYGKAQAS